MVTLWECWDRLDIFDEALEMRNKESCLYFYELMRKKQVGIPEPILILCFQSSGLIVLDRATRWKLRAAYLPGFKRIIGGS